MADKVFKGEVPPVDPDKAVVPRKEAETPKRS